MNDKFTDISPGLNSNAPVMPTAPGSLDVPQANMKFQGYENYGFVNFNGLFCCEDIYVVVYII